jgi:hypothetical protein
MAILKPIVMLNCVGTVKKMCGLKYIILNLGEWVEIKKDSEIKSQISFLFVELVIQIVL